MYKKIFNIHAEISMGEIMVSRIHFKIIWGKVKVGRNTDKIRLAMN